MNAVLLRGPGRSEFLERLRWARAWRASPTLRKALVVLLHQEKSVHLRNRLREVRELE